ncbi:MAG: 4Fe-4S dicluster domain-containing protein, partial [Myxococcota bacterium]
MEDSDRTYSRRDFFRVMGLSTAAVTAACSRAPVEKIIPYLVKPEEVTPGVASFYATTCGACPAACGLLVKTRDGRPIKIEGNPLHPLSRGGVCATGQAAVLTLYDATRARRPATGGRETTWAAQDAAIRGALARLAAEGRAIRLVAPSRMGPTEEAAIGRFLGAYPTAARVRHDALSTDAVADAHAATHGVAAVPAYRFDRARLIVGVDADFLGTWVSPVAFTRAYAEARAVGDGEGAAARRARLQAMARHVQLEHGLSLTGSNADERLPILPSDVTPVLAYLARQLGAASVAAPAPQAPREALDRLAGELDRARGAGLLVCGSADAGAQALVNAINQTLGNYGHALTLDDAVPRPESRPMASLIEELRAGTVGAVIFAGVNPVYDHPDGQALGGLLGNVTLTVSMADRRDETAARAVHLAPDHDALESWGDAEPRRGLLSLRQPAVAPLYDTRARAESLLRWAGVEQTLYDFMRARWEAEVFPRAAAASFQAFWDRSVQDGVAEVACEPIAAAYRPEGVAEVLAAHPARGAGGGLELALHAPVGLLGGALGNNGWLHELPDPIAKTTWGNAAAIAPATAARLGLHDGDEVTVAVGPRAVKLPVLVQPGVHPRVVAVALGYGRTAAGPIGNGVGANAFPLASVGPAPGEVSIRPTGRRLPLARTQTHHSMEGRPLVREVDASSLRADPDAARPPAEPEDTMWPVHRYPGHRWAMAIDLNACTGCSACVVACQAENNVPTVGADEVRRGREMHWIRIDRYYAGSPDAPRVVHQPMMCQHCENAPCETVCPVLATVHSSEGLSQQVYNRCVGTRYCANNCPFKTRRFNWFDYPHQDATANLVLNPDVVVRSRGVMEKCSMCVQRIQEGKAQAKAEGRPVRDGDAKTACQQSCPAGAIAMGDLNDATSRVARLAASGRSYRLLADLHVGPAVRYLAKIRNMGGA